MVLVGIIEQANPDMMLIHDKFTPHTIEGI